MKKYSLLLAVCNLILAILIVAMVPSLLSLFTTTYSELAKFYIQFNAPLPIPVNIGNYVFVGAIAILSAANLTLTFILILKKEKGIFPIVSLTTILISLLLCVGILKGIQGIKTLFQIINNNY